MRAPCPCEVTLETSSPCEVTHAASTPSDGVEAASCARCTGWVYMEEQNSSEGEEERLLFSKTEEDRAASRHNRGSFRSWRCVAARKKRRRRRTRRRSFRRVARKCLLKGASPSEVANRSLRLGYDSAVRSAPEACGSVLLQNVEDQLIGP